MSRTAPPNSARTFWWTRQPALRIVDASIGDDRTRTVVEIGPGHGAITAHARRRAAAVLHCIEFDPGLARELAFRFRNDPHVTVHHADILENGSHRLWPPRPMVPSTSSATCPTTSPRTSCCTCSASAREGLRPPRRAHDAARGRPPHRLPTPAPATTVALSALSQLHGTVTELFTLPPGAFDPPPEVYSTVIRLDFSASL